MGTVMMVEDAMSDLRPIESILKSAGHRVMCCEGGDRLEELMVEEEDTPVVFVSSSRCRG